MLREYTRFFRNYQKLTHLRPLYFALILITAIFVRLAMLLLPFFAALIINDLTVKNTDFSYFHLVTFALILAIYYLMLFAHANIYSIALNDIFDRLQTELLEKLMTIDSNFLREIDKGSVINTTHDYLNEIVAANDEIANLIAIVIQTTITLIIIGASSFPIMLLMVTFVLIFIFLSRYFDRRFDFYHRKTTDRDNSYSTIITQSLGGLQELKSFNILAKFQTRVDILQRKFATEYSRQSHYQLLRDNDTRYLEYILQFVAYAILILMSSRAEITIGVIVMVTTYQAQLFSCAREFAEVSSDARDTQSDLDNIAEILNYRPEKVTKLGELDLDNISGKVELSHVYYRNNRIALRDISFTLRPHQFTAIVGPPGAGKSELFNLILRLERPTRGQIKIDGINIREFSQKIYSENVVIADQTPFLFDVSIRRNLSFVDPDIEHQIEVCKTVGLHDFIESLPNGYNTILHKNAHNISSGQRQMLSIARTILSRAEILLFDGTASSLDAGSAAQLLRTIDKLKSDHTVVMITRRPDLMSAADRIIVIEQGRVIDSGSHAGLLKRCKTYRELQTFAEPEPLIEVDYESEFMPSELAEGTND